MRERIDIGGMHRHHRIEEEGEVDPFGFDRQFKGVTLAVERPGAFCSRDAETGFVSPVEHPVFNGPIGGLVDDLNRSFRDRHNGDDAAERSRFQSDESQSTLNFVEPDHGVSAIVARGDLGILSV